MKFERCNIHCLSHVYCPLAYVLPREVDPGNVSRLRSAWPALDRFGGLRQAFSYTSSSTGSQKSTLMSARNSASCRTTRETDRAWSERHSEVVNSCRDEFQVATLVTTARNSWGSCYDVSRYGGVKSRALTVHQKAHPLANPRLLLHSLPRDWLYDTAYGPIATSSSCGIDYGRRQSAAHATPSRACGLRLRATNCVAKITVAFTDHCVGGVKFAGDP